MSFDINAFYDVHLLALKPVKPRTYPSMLSLKHYIDNK